MVSIHKKILIVDDEEDLTWSIARSLTKDCKLFEIFCVNAGDKALEFLSKTSVDLVITDVRMPGINGLDLVLEVRKRYPSIKIIVMTAYGTPEIEEQADKRGAYHYIEKPFDIKNLKRLVYTNLIEPFEHFEGHLMNIRLRDVLSLYCISQNTAALNISNGADKGVVYFKGGEIVHAKCCNLSGEPALRFMLNWKKGSFKTSLGSFPVQQTISRDWQNLLMQSSVDN
ncbi:response regulator [candidate division KSB1 bacterium]|nr:response regulator [candidate division KSB1 bacterium]